QAASGSPRASAATKAALNTSPAPMVSTTSTEGAAAEASMPSGPMAIAPLGPRLTTTTAPSFMPDFSFRAASIGSSQPASVVVSISLNSASSQRESQPRTTSRLAPVQPSIGQPVSS